LEELRRKRWAKKESEETEVLSQREWDMERD
jgi:hypothetical protein